MLRSALIRRPASFPSTMVERQKRGGVWILPAGLRPSFCVEHHWVRPILNEVKEHGRGGLRRPALDADLKTKRRSS